MKQTVILTIALCWLTAAAAQFKDPVQWTYAATKKADKVYELSFTANVEKPWHIYSQNTPKGGPVPTKVTFKTNPLVKMSGGVKEVGSLKQVHDEYFDVDVKYFDGKVTFIQTVNLSAAAKTAVAGTIEYMVCNDKECLPPKKVSFDLKLQ